MRHSVSVSPQNLPELFRQVYSRVGSNAAEGLSVSLLLDSAGVGGETGNGYAMALGAEETLCLRGTTFFHNDVPVLSSATPEQLWSTFERLTASEDPTVHWCGALGYELNHWVEPTVSRRESGLPLGELFLFRPSVWVTGSAVTGTIQFETSTPSEETLALLERVIQAFEADFSTVPVDSLGLVPGLYPQDSSPEVFSAQVDRLLGHIRAGDIYQANLSLRQSWSSVSDSTAWALYRQLLECNPSPFSGFLKTPLGHIMSNSPERLVAYEPETGLLDTRPIAGTRGRGDEAERELQDNIKEHAEHLMLLDLMRNDLGRVAEPATVEVPNAFYLERYSHVTHLVSQVVARKKPDASVWDVLRAVFPGGTITGCPKVRCMQLLHGIETLPRGFYTGSLGYMTPANGQMDWNILIRSLYNWPNLNRMDAHAGAGIVADSVASWEYKECQRKFQAIHEVLSPSAAPVC